ncbi:MAG: type 2 isopentenyl-diphosphate Delta-isomerase, partial [Melioribacteraceae bacterium]|nr:type 2 isopentenyl-diphosphate Delta-isomerase [Melioribacteraceae bacterium]
MKNNQNKTSDRKKEHIELCLHSDVSFRKSTGLENYEFTHNAITEIEIDKINFESEFLGKQISFPFLISSMTGGTGEAFELNERLAIAANELNIPIGVGSQRQALENDTHLESYKVIRKYASNVPVLSNIGGAQISKLKELSSIKRIIDMVEADAVIIHLNPLQELLQKEGETNFSGLLDNIEKLKKYITKPVIIKEVGSGISKEVAEKLLNVGVDGIDVAGAGGTSWAAVELIRNKINDDNYFRDWG